MNTSTQNEIINSLLLINSEHHKSHCLLTLVFLCTVAVFHQYTNMLLHNQQPEFWSSFSLDQIFSKFRRSRKRFRHCLMHHPLSGTVLRLPRPLTNFPSQFQTIHISKLWGFLFIFDRVLVYSGQTELYLIIIALISPQDNILVS